MGTNTDPQDLRRLLDEANAVIKEKDAVIENKNAIIEEKNAAIREMASKMRAIKQEGVAAGLLRIGKIMSFMLVCAHYL